MRTIHGDFRRHEKVVVVLEAVYNKRRVGLTAFASGVLRVPSEGVLDGLVFDSGSGFYLA